MEWEKQLKVVADKYNLQYSCQIFKKGNQESVDIITYSLYNSTGCFTIHYIPVIGELEFYYSKQFSTNRERLREKDVPVFHIEPQIWKRNSKWGILKIPFYYCSAKNVIKTLVEVIEISIQKTKEFFGVQVIDTNFTIDD